MKRSRRPGYGLFQLLVVLAFLALLVGMLLPAVQKVRESASRTQSQNNLKQLGLAIHSYHDTQNAMPAGVDSKNFSGLMHLLPYLEQDAVYKNTDRTTSPDDKDNATVRATVIKTFLSNLDPVVQPDPKAGPTNYMLVAGSKASLEDNNGIFYRDSKISFANVPDGTSNTIMTVETLKGDGGKKAVSVQRQHVALKKGDLKDIKESAGVKDFQDDTHIAGNRGASWLDGRFLQSTITITRPFNDTRPDVDCGGDGGLAAPRSLLQGTNIGMADGSVRFISSSAKFETWKLLADRADGMVLPADF
jgi:type II secretory pathway pseudopilin PulG